MRPRASQVARIRLVETEEDVETYRPVLDAIKDAMWLGGAPCCVARRTGRLTASSTAVSASMTGSQPSSEG